MRLGGCILAELAVVLAGASAAREGGRLLLHLVPEARGAARPGPAARPPLPVPPLPGAIAFAPVDTFLGVRDDLLLERLRRMPIRKVKVNTGGSSLSLKLTFADGSAAAFKPIQVWAHSIPRKEIAAYRINRALGLAHVPPATARVLTRAEILGRLDPRSRPLVPRILNEARFLPDGSLPGEASYWVPVLRDAELEGFPWAEWTSWLAPGTRVPPEAIGLAPQIASMILFDFLINNPDRFSGENTLADPDLTRLFYMDNTMSFDPAPGGHPKCALNLSRVGKLPRGTLRAVAALDEAALRRALAQEPRGPFTVLTELEIEGVLRRREAILAHAQALVDAHGEPEALAFP